MDLKNITNPVGPSVKDKFGWEDYLVFGTSLLISAGIGVYFGFCGKKGKKEDSNKEFLTGNRQMKPFPVALSLTCSSFSAITILGYPVEAYLYGVQFTLQILLFIPMTLMLYYLYIPVFYNLNLTSSFEYFERRFSRSVRTLTSTFSIIVMVIYLGFVVFGPSISMAQVTGIHHRIFVVAIFVVCTFYSTMGGLAAVLWTDVLQGIIMVVSLLASLVQGFKIMGWNEVWYRNDVAHRIKFDNFDFDPRTRHSFWSAIFGFFFFFASTFGANQSNIQRYVSLPNDKAIKQCLWINLIFVTIMITLVDLNGPLLYAKYMDCDPVKSGKISTYEQMYPLFTMEILGDIVGLPGLIVAGITSASLSTVSSGLNSLSAMVTEDFVKPWKPNWSEKRLSIISKMVSVIAGVLSIAIVFIVENFDNILPVALSVQGCMTAPFFGLFTLGMFFPMANTMGALIGFLVSFIFIILLSLGSSLANIKGLLPDQKRPLSTQGCNITNFNISSLIFEESRWKEQEWSPLIQLLSINYIYYSLISFLMVIILGLVFSAFFSGREKGRLIDVECYSPPFFKLWEYLLGEKFTDHVNFKEKGKLFTRTCKSNKVFCNDVSLGYLNNGFAKE